MINPIPYIVIDGQEIPAGLDPSGDFKSVIASGFNIQWGRSDYMDQPQAGSLSITLYDKTGEWAMNQEIIGLTVSVGMRWGSSNKTIFRGRITDATLTAMHDYAEPMFSVELNCTDKIGELGQTYVSNVLWPAETYTNRANKIMAAGGNKIIAGLGGGLNPLIDAIEVQEQSLLSLTQDLFETVGDRMAYDPDTNRLEAIGRLSLPGSNQIRLQLDGSGLYGVGLATATGPSISAQGLTSSDGLHRSISSGITEVRVTHNRTNIGSGQTYKYTSTASTGLSEAQLGRRALTVNTEMYDLISGTTVSQHSWIDWLLGQYVSICKEEGQQWSHPPVMWDSRLNGGFRSEAELYTLLRCTEVRVPVHFQSSVYNSIVNHVPVYRIIGGTVEFIGGPDGGWFSTINPGPVYVLNSGDPLTWNTVNTSSSKILGWDDLDEISGWGSYEKATIGVS